MIRKFLSKSSSSYSGFHLAMLIHHQPESKCTPFLIPVAGSLPIPLQSIQSSILGGHPHLFFLSPELIILARLSRKVIDCFISPVPLCDQLRAVTVVPCLSDVPEASYPSETWHPGPSVIKLDASNPSIVFLAPVIQSSAPGSQAWHFSVPWKLWSPSWCKQGSVQQEPSSDPGAGFFMSFQLMERILCMETYSLLQSVGVLVASVGS